MSKSHMFSYSNINKSSPLTYLGLDFYFFFCLWEIYPFYTGDSFARKTVAIWNKWMGYWFSVAMEDFSHF